MQDVFSNLILTLLWFRRIKIMLYNCAKMLLLELSLVSQHDIELFFAIMLEFWSDRMWHWTFEQIVLFLFLGSWLQFFGFANCYSVTLAMFSIFIMIRLVSGTIVKVSSGFPTFKTLIIWDTAASDSISPRFTNSKGWCFRSLIKFCLESIPGRSVILRNSKMRRTDGWVPEIVCNIIWKHIWLLAKSTSGSNWSVLMICLLCVDVHVIVFEILLLKK